MCSHIYIYMSNNICIYGLSWGIRTMKIYITTKKSHTIQIRLRTDEAGLVLVQCKPV